MKIRELKTYYLLGYLNILRVICYRLRKKFGLYVRSYPVQQLDKFFYKMPRSRNVLKVSDDREKEAYYFGWYKIPFIATSPPNWYLNPYNGYVVNELKPWFQLADFDSHMGDIKWIWEASRFSWILIKSRQASMGCHATLVQLNIWLHDWLIHNPPYLGVNWKCGQEASLRILYLAMGACILKQEHEPSTNLVSFILIHLKRIRSTFGYAIAQDNNHGISEAAALFVGGSWLMKQGISQGGKYVKLGRKYLENRAKKLFMLDGGCSQYSVNYHSVILEIFCVVEIWRRKLGLHPFSKQLNNQLIAGMRWLAIMVDPRTGDAPNIGANDGSRFFSLIDDRRDYRFVVQLTAALFVNKLVYNFTESWIEIFNLFDIEKNLEKIKISRSQLLDTSGFAVLSSRESCVVLRYPRFKFRPSQCDLLHVDFWLYGENMLRDAGTYSYAAAEDLYYFSGTQSHNTIQFDDRDQMPRLSRFLFGDWLKTDSIESLHAGQAFAASYRDKLGVYHRRKVILSDKKLTVIDDFYGFRNKAVLRWRLKDTDWILSENQLVGSAGRLSVSATIPIERRELIRGLESRYYFQKNETPVFEVEVNQAGQITTEYTWCL